MDKTKPDQTLSGRPIANRMVAKRKLHWQRKVVNINNVITGRFDGTDEQRHPAARPCEYEICGTARSEHPLCGCQVRP